MFVRTNVLIRRYSKCSDSVKVLLFRTFCLGMYDVALWKNYTVSQYNKFKYCYHKCIKKMFRYGRMDGITNILIVLSLPSFATMMHNCRCVFFKQCASSTNGLYEHLRNIGIFS